MSGYINIRKESLSFKHDTPFDFMEYEKNFRYLKSSDLHFYVGIVLLAMGAIFLMLGWFFWIYVLPYQDIISLFLVLLGGCIAWIPRSMRSDEKEIDKCVAERTSEYAKDVIDRFHLSGDLLSKMEPIVTGGFVLDEDGVVFRRGKNDRKYRSSRYIATALIFTKNGIFAATKMFSLIEEDENESVKEILFYDIDDAAVNVTEKQVGDDKVKFYRLAITASGKTVLDIPVVPSAQMDQLCGEILSQSVKAKE